MRTTGVIKLASGVLARAAAGIGAVARPARRRLRRVDPVNAAVAAALLLAASTLLAAPLLFLKIAAWGLGIALAPVVLAALPEGFLAALVGLALLAALLAAPSLLLSLLLSP